MNSLPTPKMRRSLRSAPGGVTACQPIILIRKCHGLASRTSCIREFRTVPHAGSSASSLANSATHPPAS